MSAHLANAKVAVVGAGTMGAGIAQVAATAGHEVYLHDAAPSAAEKAKEKITARLQRQVDRGKLDDDMAQAAANRIVAVAGLQELADCGLVIEAIVEDLQAKSELFRQLEQTCSADVVLATNTSAIPLERIGACLESPQRLAGLHFFNPPIAMRLVEVIRHEKIAVDLAEKLADLMRGWGKEPIIAASAPGFVANRISRPFFIEALRLHEECGIAVDTIDECLRGCAAFRMGPFALMDLIGIDVNCANNKGIHKGLGEDPRIAPGKLQARMVAQGKLGKKSGAGFYDYASGDVSPPQDPYVGGSWPSVDGLLESNGTCASDLGGQVAVRDWCLPGIVPKAVAVAFSDKCDAGFKEGVMEELARSDVRAHEVPDTPGLIALRVVAALVATAADALAAKVASLADMDKAMRLGMNHPHGPGGWARIVGTDRIKRTLAMLDKGAPAGRYAPCDLALLEG